METKTQVVAQKLNDKVFSVIGQNALKGFEQAFLVADAIKELKVMLTAEYMKPIMQLQGNKLGFRTDKDKTGGYPEEVVKNCLIEAVLMGLQPHGNQFNIIAGNTYPTKEGMGELLKKIDGLNYEIIPAIPKAISDKTSSVDMNIKWAMNGATSTTVILPVSIKIDAYASVDSVIGKATRKARKWLFEKVTGVEITDGEVSDVESTVMQSTPLVNKEAERIELMISDADTIEIMLAIEPDMKSIAPQLQEVFDKKLAIMKGTK